MNAEVSRAMPMKTVRVMIDPANPGHVGGGRIDTARVDATTENRYFQTAAG